MNNVIAFPTHDNFFHRLRQRHLALEIKCRNILVQNAARGHDNDMLIAHELLKAVLHIASRSKATPEDIADKLRHDIERMSLRAALIRFSPTPDTA